MYAYLSGWQLFCVVFWPCVLASAQCQHLVLHQVGYGSEFEKGCAKSLHRFRQLDAWTMSLISGYTFDEQAEANVHCLGRISAVDRNADTFDLLFDLL